MSDDASGDVIISEPRRKVKIEIPDIDKKHLLKGDWQVGHHDCFADTHICLLGCFCPCILMGWSAEKLDENVLLFCLGSLCLPMIVPLRIKTREKFNIKSDIISDTIMAGPCCSPCSNCQVAYELKLRGL